MKIQYINIFTKYLGCGGALNEYQKHVWLNPPKNSLTGKCVFCMHNCLIITKIRYSTSILFLFTQSKYICVF